MIIDAHQHFWKYNPSEYGWIDDSMQCLRRDFLPADLEGEIAAVGVDGVVSVQARQCIAETDWLLEFGRRCPAIQGIVGWLPLTSRELAAHLDRLRETKLKGLRHVVQSEGIGFLDNPQFNQGVAELGSRGLVYDLLIFEQQREEATRFVDRYPFQSFVIDHIAKPKIKQSQLEPWRTSIGELAKGENVSCKLSGMVTEADYLCWSDRQLRPYFDIVFESFGPDRLMFGSDWPVCLLGASYERWINVVREYIAPLAADEQSAILGGTATRIYHL